MRVVNATFEWLMDGLMEFLGMMAVLLSIPFLIVWGDRLGRFMPIRRMELEQESLISFHEFLTDLQDNYDMGYHTRNDLVNLSASVTDVIVILDSIIANWSNDDVQRMENV